MAELRGMTAEDVGQLVDVSDPRLSPDGRTVAFVVSTIDLDANEYRNRIWLAAADGSSPPRAFTAGDGRDRVPRWSPDGRELAFVSHREDKGSELYVIPTIGGGEVRKVCAWPEEIDDVAWSPDGRTLAFGARDRDEERYAHDKDKDRPPRRITRLTYRLDSVGWTADRPRHLFVVAAAGGMPRAVTDSEAGDGGLAWTSDGRSLLFSGMRHSTWDIDRASDLFRIDLDLDALAAGAGLPTPVQLTKTGENYGGPVAKPDGTAIGCHYSPTPMSTPRHVRIAALDAGGGNVTVLNASLDRQSAPFGASNSLQWSGDDLYFLVEDRGNQHLYRVAGDGASEPALVLGGERIIASFDIAGDALVFVAGDAVSLPELFVTSLSAPRNERKLTDLGGPFARARTLPAPEKFPVVSSGGVEVDAWAIRPVGFEPGKRYPALLNIHGGPFTQYGNKLFDEFQVQANAGYVVLYANPRGSSGFTEAWGRAIRGPRAEDDPGSGWGGVDYDDLMAVVDAAIDQFDFVDPERLGVLGGSYGGFMTSWMVGHTDRFKAACSERAVNNRLTSCWTSDIGVWFRTQLGPSHLDAPEDYLERSPITFVADVHTPLLILHSENDLRCPIEQAEQFFVALRMLGRDVEFVRFPGESHELSRSGSPKHRVQRFEILLDYFARKLA
jgi:dipeptidyl aminopeptidase/acylaminoacyl peptidase